MLEDKLSLPYQDWDKLVKDEDMTDSDREWLVAWQHYDLNVNFESDKLRSRARHAHYVAWYVGRSWLEQAVDARLKGAMTQISNLEDVVNRKKAATP